MCLGYKGPWLESYTDLFFKREFFVQFIISVYQLSSYVLSAYLPHLTIVVFKSILSILLAVF